MASPAWSSMSPILRLVPPQPSCTSPLSLSAAPSERISSSPVILPKPSLTEPFPCSYLPSTSSLFGTPIPTMHLLKVLDCVCCNCRKCNDHASRAQFKTQRRKAFERRRYGRRDAERTLAYV